MAAHLDSIRALRARTCGMRAAPGRTLRAPVALALAVVILPLLQPRPSAAERHGVGLALGPTFLFAGMPMKGGERDSVVGMGLALELDYKVSISSALSVHPVVAAARGVDVWDLDRGPYDNRYYNLITLGVLTQVDLGNGIFLGTRMGAVREHRDDPLPEGPRMGFTVALIVEKEGQGAWGQRLSLDVVQFESGPIGGGFSFLGLYRF